MNQPVILPSKKSIDKAGAIVATSVDYTSDIYIHAYTLISDWRGYHAGPLQNFQGNLTKNLTYLGVNPDAYILSKRLKRIVSIISKLQRNPHSQLSRFQDIGGIRIILPDMKAVTLLQDIYIKDQSHIYPLIRQKDYIQEPKKDGYRSIHMVFGYNSQIDIERMGLQLELQIRTRVQHARATAIETAGHLTRSLLKANQGPAERLEYFRYVSVGFAYMEGTKIDDAYKHLSPQAIVHRIVQLDQTYLLTSKLQLFSKALHSLNVAIDLGKSILYIISLQLDVGFQIYPYTQEQEKIAFAQYQQIEQEFLGQSDKLVVLVGVEDIDDLQKAYPSFFGDNDLFLEYVQQVQKIYL